MASASHGQRLVAGPHSQGFGARRKRFGEGFEVRLGIVKTGTSHTDVFVNHVLALARELQFQNVLENMEIEIEKVHDGTQGDGVLYQLVAVVVG
jgi:hypothetical protein